MIQDPASLARLHDVVEPDTVSFWPPAPGWWIVLAATATMAGALCWNGYVAWRRNAYRRAALAELPTTEPTRIPALLKRVALAAYPREQVASLSGDAWLEFLERTGGVPMHRGLLDLAYCVKANDVAAIRAACANWIRRHDRSAT